MTFGKIVALDVGDVRIDCQLTDEEAQEALDFLREC